LRNEERFAQEQERDMAKEILKSIPSVDELLRAPELQNVADTYRHEYMVRTVREVMDDTRTRILSGKLDSVSHEQLIQEVLARLRRSETPSLRKVINATGIILHTGLGRAVLSEEATARLVETARGYCNLETELDSGKRGKRGAHVEGLLCELTGAEDALVVNNNAAAVMLALNTLSLDREVIIARGELIEIGGSFRLPEIMAKSGCRLKEVGTTNRTTIEDYERAIGDRTGALMKAHQSNYKIVGFAVQASIEEIVSLGLKAKLPVIYDLGSGAIVDMRTYGLDYEPMVRDVVASGVHVVTFSADKLMGGPQAGVAVGKKDLIDRMKKNPLARALRLCKLTLGALEGTLRSYLHSANLFDELPTLRAITASYREVSRRASRLARTLRTNVGDTLEVKVVDGASMIGGGSFPVQELRTRLLSLRPKGIKVDALASKLRLGAPPVFARIDEDRLVLDPRTVQKDEEKGLIDALSEALQPKKKQ
jgi:L-seryl-tRNA(Ser) seleniumtransferase